MVKELTLSSTFTLTKILYSLTKTINLSTRLLVNSSTNQLFNLLFRPVDEIEMLCRSCECGVQPVYV